MIPNKPSWKKVTLPRSPPSRQSGEEVVASIGINPPLRVLDLACAHGTTAVRAEFLPEPRPGENT